jgi:uncharacterized protein YcgL (UPF0745 family)
MINSQAFARHGDKENSPFFESYLKCILAERDRLGLTELVHEVDALMITVDPDSAVEYVTELCLMTPYHYVTSLESESHWTHILRIDLDSPDLIVREVKDDSIRGIFRSLNETYPVGSKRPNSRYMGEIIRVKNKHEVEQIQQSREFRFFNPAEIKKLELPSNLVITKPSPYTHNIVAYLERDMNEPRIYALGESKVRNDVQAAYDQAKNAQNKLGITDLILPIDHLATRVYSQNREVAILEYLSLSSYRFWGAYNIKDQNSSTNVTKSVHPIPESKSPAKVFTANNTPYFVNHLEQLPSPTETFVRNYGPRLHHMALAVKDGETNGIENIDFVVNAIAEQGKGFLLEVIGSKEEGLKQIFSNASQHSSLIIEYVQRFGDFDGFFTKENVAALTEAAGLQEGVNR